MYEFMRDDPATFNPPEREPIMTVREIDAAIEAKISDWLCNVERIEQALDNIGSIRDFPRYLVMLSTLATGGPAMRARAAENIVALLRDALRASASESVMRGQP